MDSTRQAKGTEMVCVGKGWRRAIKDYQGDAEIGIGPSALDRMLLTLRVRVNSYTPMELVQEVGR